MNKKLLLLVALLVVTLATIYVLRQKDDGATLTPPPTKVHQQTRKATKRRASPSPKTTHEPTAPARVLMDDDPVGVLLLEGQVVDDQGLSLAGAVVRINSNPKRTTVTEKDGTFRFDKLVGRNYSLWAQQGNQTGGPVRHRLTDSSDPVIVRTQRGANVIVTVVTKDQEKAVTGALVSIEGGAKSLKATTDAQGKAKLQGVGRGFSKLVVSASGFALTRQLLQVPDNVGSTPFESRVTIAKGAVASGTVVDESGKPVAGAQVMAVDTSALISLAKPKTDGGLTDEAGKFTTSALAAGNYRFSAHKSGFRPSTSESRATDGINETTGLTIILKQGRLLSGRVVDESKSPVAWATVRVRPEGRGIGAVGGTRQVVADESGHFELLGLNEQELLVLAAGKDASSAIVSVDLRKKSQTDLELVLDVKGILSGSVVDSKGESVPEVQITATPDIWDKGPAKGFTLRGTAKETTDGGGGFTFRGLPPGKYRLRASRTSLGRGGHVKKGVVAKTGDTGVKVVLAADGGVKGKLVYSDGGPVKSFTVTVGFPPGVPVATEDGRFEVKSIPPGSYDMHLRGLDFAPVTLRDVNIGARAITDVGSIKASRGRGVVGQVVDKSGAPVVGASVVLAKQLLGDGKNVTINVGKGITESFAMKTMKTDSLGRFVFKGVGKTEMLIIADHPEKGRSLPQAVVLETKAASLELVLKPFGRLVGKVVLDGTPAPGIAVIVTPKSVQKQNLVVKTASDGAYSLERVPEGEHRVLAMSGGGTSSNSAGKTVKVEAGKEVRADITIDVGRINLRVKVEGKAGTKIQMAQVFLFKGKPVDPKTGKEIQAVYLAAGGGAKMAFAMGTGEAKFPKITAGAYSICTLPIEGDMADAKFRQRLQEHAAKLKVYCQRYTAPETPLEQSTKAIVPQMEPLPEPAN